MIRLHDTLAREKRPFVPQNPQRITMYVCGPTVYGRAHIGNARPAVVFDTLARLIRHEFGAKSLAYARNVTDVDDKIIASAEADRPEWMTASRTYPLLNASGRAIVDWVEARRLKPQPIGAEE